MADTGIFCNNANVLKKAGANADSTATAEAYTNDYIAQVESRINVMSQFNWSDAYTTLNDDVKMILKEAASNLAAIYCITYNMRGYTSRTEAQTMLDVLKDAFLECVSLLRDIKKRDFMNGA